MKIDPSKTHKTTPHTDPQLHKNDSRYEALMHQISRLFREAIAHMERKK